MNTDKVMDVLETLTMTRKQLQKTVRALTDRILYCPLNEFKTVQAELFKAQKELARTNPVRKTDKE